MYAVMGITGNVGGAVAETLLQHGQRVRGIVRNPAKAQVLGRPRRRAPRPPTTTTTSIAAFTGVEGVFAMIPPNIAPAPGFPDSIARIAALKRALLAATPPRAVFLSSIGSEKESGLGLIGRHPHPLSRNSPTTGVPSAFLRAGSFMENNLYSIPAARATGNYFAF